MKLNSFFALVCAGMLAACSTAQEPQVAITHKNEQAVPIPNPPNSAYRLVDPQATAETASLLAYLHAVSGRAILFGHQHDTTQGLTLTDPHSGRQSDTLAAVGDYPAVYGWDTLSIVGQRPEGSIETQVRAAYARGGIITISTHLPNPTTQTDAWDTTQAVPHVLPGGKDQAKYIAQLDQFADWALAMKDAHGRPIPLILRILHENTGSWFWWGAAFSTPDQYRNLFRFTVNYLRDVRQVHNLLFAYSPSDDFSGSEARFLERYPGDEYVDLIGFDSYGPAKGSAEWRHQLVQNAAMLGRFAKAHGKVAALTEVGLQPDDLAKGHKDPQWFTELLKALRADPDARQLAYMLVWRNGGPDQYWVPVAAQKDGMLDDFRQFYADPEVFFNRSLRDVYNRSVQVQPTLPLAYLMSPTDLQKLSGQAVIRARLEQVAEPAKVMFQVGTLAPIPLQKGQGLYYEGVLDTHQLADNQSYVAQLSVSGAYGQTLTHQTRLIVSNQVPARDPALIEDFGGYYQQDELLRQGWSQAGDPIQTHLIKPVDIQPTPAMQVSFSLGSKGYTGLTHALAAENWSDYRGIRFWLDPDQHGQRLVVQLMSGQQAWEAYLIMGANSQGLTAADVNPNAEALPIPAVQQAGWVTLPFSVFKPAPWGSSQAALTLSKVSAFSLYVNALTKETRVTEGRYRVADIRLVR